MLPLGKRARVVQMIPFLIFVAFALTLVGILVYAIHHWPASGADNSAVVHAERCGGGFGLSHSMLHLTIPLVNLLVKYWGLDISYPGHRFTLHYELMDSVRTERLFLFTAVRVTHHDPKVPEEMLLYSLRNPNALVALIQQGIDKASYGAKREQ